MDISAQNTHDTESTQNVAVILGGKIRLARKSRGLTMQELADKIGRPREWLNRVELGYSMYGEYKPPTRSDIQTILDSLRGNFEENDELILNLALQAEAEFNAIRLKAAPKRASFGKLTQTEVIIGESQVVQAIVDMIHEQHSDAIIRNTGIKTPGNYMGLGEEWKKYRHAIGEFLSSNPNALFKRVEHVTSQQQLDQAKSADEKTAGKRPLESVHNVKLKFYKHNPMQMHVVIGQREAILALPQTSGQAGSNVALLIRDKIFVEALRVWYDEVLWDAPGECAGVEFTDFQASFDKISQLYGFKS